MGLHLDLSEWRHEDGEWVRVYERAADDPDAVSLSFGPVAVTGTAPYTATKNLHIMSMRSTTTSYSTAFVAASMPAVSHSER